MNPKILGYNTIENYKIHTFLTSHKILEKIISSSDNTISKQEIAEIMKDNLDRTPRALDKLIERSNDRFRKIFSLSDDEYYYNRRIKKYTLILENMTNLMPYRALSNFIHASIVCKRLDANYSSKAFLADNESTYRSTQSLFKLIEAINNKKAISFNHENLVTGEVHYHEMDGWFIKQYEHKFYLMGLRTKRNSVGTKDYRHFDISQVIDDSIIELDRQIDDDYKYSHFPQIEAQIFDQCIGVRISRDENQDELCLKTNIIVETTYALGKSWLKNPVHNRQKCIKLAINVEGSFQFEFTNFYLNSTFKSLIIRELGKAKIIAPKEAVEEFRNIVNQF